MTGTQGVFRGLKRHASNTASVAGLLGTLTGSREVAAVGQFATALENIPYEEIALDARVGADRSFVVERFALRSAEILIEGSGSVKPTETGSWLQWPLSLSLNFAGKGRIEQMLNSMRIAAPQANAQGYTPLRFPFRVAGSIAGPDASELWKTIGQSAASTLIESRTQPKPAAAPAPAVAPKAPQP